MEARVATWTDVESVLDRLSEQHRVEYEALGWPSEEFLARMARYMAEADTKCLWFDGKPQAVLAIKPGAPLPTTWLAVTKEFYGKGMGPTRFARRYMQQAVQRHGPILSVIGSGHPQAAKWMKVLGYQQIGENIFLFA